MLKCRLPSPTWPNGSRRPSGTSPAISVMPRSISSGIRPTGTEMSLRTIWPSWRMAGLSSSRIRHSMARCASLAASVASSTSPASNASASQASAAAASPSGRDQASSASTYQGASVASGIAHAVQVRRRRFDAAGGHQLEAGDQLGEALLAVGQERDRRLRRRHGGEDGDPLARAGEQAQRGGGDDSEAALRARGTSASGRSRYCPCAACADRSRPGRRPALPRARARARAPCRSG